MKLFLASSNPGKLREYRELATGTGVEIALLPNFSEIPQFEESAPTFAENAAGKALHYSRSIPAVVLADDSGLVVPVLGGAPGVRSARYAGPDATDEQNVEKLRGELRQQSGGDRRARFVCVIAVACQGRMLVVTSDFVQGIIAAESRGTNGFGYDPVFLFPDMSRTFAEIIRNEKNAISHRGKAFRKTLEYLNQPKFCATK